jgi:hypothetical protein
MVALNIVNLQLLTLVLSVIMISREIHHIVCCVFKVVEMRFNKV